MRIGHVWDVILLPQSLLKSVVAFSCFVCSTCVRRRALLWNIESGTGWRFVQQQAACIVCAVAGDLAVQRLDVLLLCVSTSSLCGNTSRLSTGLRDGGDHLAVFHVTSRRGFRRVLVGLPVAHVPGARVPDDTQVLLQDNPCKVGRIVLH